MMLLNCAIDLLKRDLSVLYLDSELNTRLFTARVLSHISGVEYKRLTSGTYTEKEAKRIISVIVLSEQAQLQPELIKDYLPRVCVELL